MNPAPAPNDPRDSANPWHPRADGLPLIMGILNVTPDSFSDGGEHSAPAAAVARGLTLAAEGADVIDIGAESTRPDAAAVDADEEWRRLGPVVGSLAAELGRRGLRAAISIDSYRAATAKHAMDAVAAAGRVGNAEQVTIPFIINDVTAGTADPAMLALAASSGCGLCLMHMRGSPQTMQKAPDYADVVGEVETYLQARIAAARAAGVAQDRIRIDPGIGFGKTLDHNLALIRAIPRLSKLAPVLIGVSRKSMLAKLSADDLAPVAPARERLAESLAAAVVCAELGASVLRVHDVGETIRALRVARALATA